MKIAVFGARGRVGSLVCETVEATPGLDLVAGVDQSDARDGVLGADVVVDFTHPDSVMDNLAWCVGHGIHAVVGTTGFTPARLDEVRSLVGGSDQLGVLIAPNFSIGAVLMMHFSAVAAPYFDSVEIIEAHHAGKADAPSGTASTTARLVAQARASAGAAPMPDATTHAADGARGTVVDGVHVHSLRLPGLIAQQEVRLTSAGETLTIVNDARSRSCYMPGVLAGISWVVAHPGVTVGLEPVLGLTHS
ncbi:MAG: 4-hydroxy-tetrahydrodipicolinate reductase [Propionibacteriaceae bacterium]|nr:4-hydroxy-tetrahydrodipicolinate reductase [Propionibacteriaceae bacterium]